MKKVNILQVGGSHPEERIPIYRPDREKMAENLMMGLGKMLGMPSVPEWNSIEDYLKEPYRVFADQILALIDPEQIRKEGFSLRQKELKEWQVKNFGVSSVEDMVLGMAEEVGELAHWILKRK